MHSENLTAGAEQVIKANALNRGLAKTSLQDTRDNLHEVPPFIYSYRTNTGNLHRTSLVTGRHSSHRVPHTSSSLAAIGVKCLEEAYSSLAEVILLQ
jgi:hypothetical protein